RVGCRAVGAGRAHRNVVRGGRFPIEERTVGHRHHAGRGVNCEPPTGVVDQRIGHAVGGGVGVAGRGGNADRRAVRRVLVYSVGGGASIGGDRHIELVHVVHVDGENSVGRRA